MHDILTIIIKDVLNTFLKKVMAVYFIKYARYFNMLEI